MRKAAVLPDPVSATPMMSRFCKPIGIACRWMGVGSYKHKVLLEHKFQIRAVPPKHVPEGGEWKMFYVTLPTLFNFFQPPPPLHFSIMYFLM